MKISNILSNNKKYINNITNFMIDIAKELSLIIWVTIVFLLIIWSYIVNSKPIFEKKNIKLYEKLSNIIEIEKNKKI